MHLGNVHRTHDRWKKKNSQLLSRIELRCGDWKSSTLIEDFSSFLAHLRNPIIYTMCLTEFVEVMLHSTRFWRLVCTTLKRTDCRNEPS
jgi:hypothetical protein